MHRLIINPFFYYLPNVENVISSRTISTEPTLIISNFVEAGIYTTFILSYGMHIQYNDIKSTTF